MAVWAFLLRLAQLSRGNETIILLCWVSCPGSFHEHFLPTDGRAGEVFPKGRVSFWVMLFLLFAKLAVTPEHIYIKAVCVLEFVRHPSI